MCGSVSGFGRLFFRGLVFAGVWLAVISGPARAADTPGGVQAEPYANAFVVTFGRFYPQGTTPSSRGSAWALTLGGERQYRSGFRLGADISLYYSKYNTPPLSGGPFTVIDDDMSLSTIGFNGMAAWALRSGGVEFRAGAGLGLYASTMRAYATTFGLPGWHDEQDVNVGYVALLALDFRTGPSSRFGLEARHLSLDGNFGALSNNTKMAIGGNALLLTYRASFGKGQLLP